MNDAAVTLAGVAKRYGALRAVEDVDLVLRPGERVALVGHNGAGKSTLIKLMLGLVRPSQGRVEVLGEDPARGASAEARTAIGYLPENVVFPPAMTGAELLAFYARLKRRPVAANAAILERVGIAAAAGRHVGTYSKGMRQRLGLAQALIGEPRILLLDEPTTGLDPALRQSFYEIVAEVSRGGATVLLSSHALAELEAQADRVVVMNEGHKVADGTIGELRRLASRPVRIRVAAGARGLAVIADRIAPLAPCDRVGEKGVEIRCAEADKLEILRQVAALPDLRDIAIAMPTLDEIYAHFLRREARP